MRWRARLLKSPIYLLLTSRKPAKTSPTQAGMRHHKAGGGGTGRGGEGTSNSPWLTLIKRRAAAACRPRNLARLVGAFLVAALLIIIITKGYSARRRSACKCTKFAHSQCQPYDGKCGPGVKRAFCQQKRCLPRRKLIRCETPCDGQMAIGGGDHPSALKPGRDGPVGACVYAVRRQSRWTKCGPPAAADAAAAKHRSRLLFLQSGTGCPPTRLERRPCKSEPRSPKGCTYEQRGAWTECNRERNEIINTRRLTHASGSDGGGDGCPMELRTAMRCLRRNGSLRCIYTKWSRWSQCTDGIRFKSRSLVQGHDCSEVARLVQNCPPPQEQSQRPKQQKEADTILRK